jgi:hypothetical protein
VWSATSGRWCWYWCWWQARTRTKTKIQGAPYAAPGENEKSTLPGPFERSRAIVQGKAHQPSNQGAWGAAPDAGHSMVGGGWPQNIRHVIAQRLVWPQVSTRTHTCFSRPLQCTLRLTAAMALETGSPLLAFFRSHCRHWQHFGGCMLGCVHPRPYQPASPDPFEQGFEPHGPTTLLQPFLSIDSHN